MNKITFVGGFYIMGVKFIKAAVIYLVGGVLWGMYMSITHDFASASGHTHLLGLGWDVLAISGIIYCIFKEAGKTKLAQVQFWTGNIGTILMVVGVTLMAYKKFQFKPITAVGGIIVTLSIIVFVVNIFKYVSENKG
jgi:hypothetical protein